jgi:hypothetical protein
MGLTSEKEAAHPDGDPTWIKSKIKSGRGMIHKRNDVAQRGNNTSPLSTGLPPNLVCVRSRTKKIHARIGREESDTVGT